MKDREAAAAAAAAAAAPAFRVKATAQAVTPRSLPDRDKSAPNQVSDADESCEVLLESSEGSLSHSLRPISSSEVSTQKHGDGHWNIPFDGSFENLVSKSPLGKGEGHANALTEIGFVPISKEGRGRCSGGTEVTPLKPIAMRSIGAPPFAQAIMRRGLLKDSLNGKRMSAPKEEITLFVISE